MRGTGFSEHPPSYPFPCKTRTGEIRGLCPQRDPERIFMTDYIEKFGRYMEAERRCSASTVDIYTRDLRDFEAYLRASSETTGAFEPETVRLEDVRGWVMHEVERGIAVGSVNRKISTLRSFFRYLMREGVVARNPVHDIKALRSGRHLPAFVEQNRMAQLIRVLEEPSEEFAAERDAMVVLMLYACGLRRSELASLTLQSLDLAARTVRVMGKGAKERLVPLLPEIASRLEHYLQVRKGEKICEEAENCLFLSNKGKRLSAMGVYTIVRAYLTLAGVQGKRSPHVLRHTFATHLMQHGASVRTVQQLLGHASLAATQIYTHNTIESLKKAYDKAHPRAVSNQEKKEDKV